MYQGEIHTPDTVSGCQHALLKGWCLVRSHSVFHTILRLPVVSFSIGPDTFLPLTAVLGALLGAVLLGWRLLSRLVDVVWHQARKKVPPSLRATHDTSNSTGQTPTSQ